MNKYIIETLYEGKIVLLNTVTQTFLPIDASEDLLRQHFFLEGQEKDAIERRLFFTPNKLSLSVIPTWRCNLRCTHCSVLHLLDNSKQKTYIDFDATKIFLENYFQRYNTKVLSMIYIGGESMLRIDDCLSMSDVAIEVCKKHKIILEESTTTNLSFHMNKKHIELFNRLSNLAVSVDGNEEQHNEQRHGYKKEMDCYAITMNNIKKLVALGFKDKLFIQAAVKDQYINHHDIREYYKTMIKLGVKKERIFYGSIHPTITNPTINSMFIKARQKPKLRPLPCCKFRWMGNLQINPDNTVSDNFFDQTDDDSILGTIYDSIEKLEEKHKTIILRGMPALKDPVCMECSGFGYCYGMCVNSDHVLKSPSQYCAKEGLIQLIKEEAATGNLLRHSMPVNGLPPDVFNPAHN